MNRQTILEYLRLQKPALEQKYRMMSIGLFGSFARDEQDAGSDIDLVYTMPEGARLSYFQVIELENEIKSHFMRDVELVNYKYLNPIIKYKADKEIVYV
jgi:predicted nucleotidyltransferase